MSPAARSHDTPELAPRPAWERDLRAIALLLVITLPWWLALRVPLILLDDVGYIAENPDVMSGISGHSITAALSSTRGAFYIPLTWISLSFDVSLFGKGSPGFHFTNILLHIANTLLAYFFFRKATGDWARSVSIAGLFSIHPLRVESVAWAVERKDVLAAFFGLLAMHAYLAAVAAGGVRRRMSFHLLTAVLFALSLLAKPMLAPLPLLLLLVDLWPLERWGFAGAWSRLPRLIAEKTPLLIASAVIIFVNYRLQLRLGGIAPWPLGSRLANAVLSYALYLRDQVYFQDLAIYYPFQEVSTGGWAIAVLVLGVATGLVLVLLWNSKKAGLPAFVGWCWFLGMLVPNIGIVQSGMQSRGDRFTYFPSLGLFLMVVWLWPGRWLQGQGRKLSTLAAGCSIFALAVYTTLRLLVWANPIVLYTDALEHTGPNPVMEFVLGRELQNEGNISAAELHFERAVGLLPEFHEAHDALGAVYALERRFPEALQQFQRAHDLAPENPYYSMKVEALRAQVETTRPGAIRSGSP